MVETVRALRVLKALKHIWHLIKKEGLDEFWRYTDDGYEYIGVLESSLEELASALPAPPERENWQFFCSHANEVPNICPCPPSCGCRRTSMCKDKPLAAPPVPPQQDQSWRRPYRVAMVQWLTAQEQQFQKAAEDYPQGGYQRQVDLIGDILDLVESSAPPVPPAPETALCDCGAELTQCRDCAVADWQAAHPDCPACMGVMREFLNANLQPSASPVPAETEPPPHLFTLGNRRLHSGELTDWKIECDALTDQDYDALARMLAQRLPAFGAVEGVPRGGLRLMEALAPYANKDSYPLLIVDDVLTTGGSLETHRDGRPAIGAVLFARGACPPWVTPLFQMPSAPTVAAPTADLPIYLDADVQGSRMRLQGGYTEGHGHVPERREHGPVGKARGFTDGNANRAPSRDRR